MEGTPRAVRVFGARTHNLKDIDVDVPLWSWVAVTGLSGSGKSSLAMDVLYAEGYQRLLDGLATYTRRRIGQAGRPDVDRIEFLPATLALRQRPPLPGRRSTVGTMSEALNVLRLMVSRLGSHVCPRGHRLPPSLDASMGEWRTCPEDGERFKIPSAESFAFNSEGACPRCDGLGVIDEIDDDALIPDPSLSIDEGAVRSWRLAARGWMPRVARAMGVRTDVPFEDLSAKERQTVLDGPPEKRPIIVTTKAGRGAEINALFENARAAVRNSMESASTEKGRARLTRFFRTHVCPACHGSRLRPEALTSLLDGRNIAELSALTLDDVARFAEGLTERLPSEMRGLSERLTGEFERALTPLRDLGLGYLTLDRAGDTLSTGERQRIQLTSTLQTRSTGMLYVLDEPSVGLHPANAAGLVNVVRALVGNGNSVVMVDHEVDLIRHADHLIEMGPGAGRAGGTVVVQGTADDLEAEPESVTGPYLARRVDLCVREPRPVGSDPQITVGVSDFYTLHDVTAHFPLERLTLVTGVSGAGKTALVLDSLVPALRAELEDRPLPEHVGKLDRQGVRRIVEVDSTPVGKNARSTPATYSGAFDAVRRMFADTPEARRRGWDAGHFSYNVKSGQCPTCEGLGTVSLDVQYLPDMSVTCPTCHGTRYKPEILEVKADGLSVADVLALTVADGADRFADNSAIATPLRALAEVGLGYLCLGEPTPVLSGGEAQRMRLASGLHRPQRHTLYVFDEPTTGLHPRDVRTLLGVLDRLLDAGATIIAIDHDLDLIANADHVVDLGPGGGPQGGRVVASGSPAEITQAPDSLTGHYLRLHLQDTPTG
ncbi:excinuclease ABC subunit UvrA [Actinomadura rupiterrae]|uniref:excinuclease ABC subunit UvrA n=1 Tax=Actinomadura rupiterrae TaxID=559627 RepID=UPI0020A3C909|nr:excinuclease ABC subunit UvrA [Actinomadura rupiterrae]MCP2339413.1 excinuclease ABC subunit A [Actinomadura rupiterrae]